MTPSTTSCRHRRQEDTMPSTSRTPFLQYFVLVVVFALLTAAPGLNTMALAQEDGVTLRVFGPSSLDQLAPQATEDDRQRIQQEVIDGFLAENPNVAEVIWDAQGPIEEGTTRLMTAHLAGEPIDLIACAANNTNGAFIRRGVVRDITAEVAPFQDRIDPAALAAYTVGGKVYGVPISTLSTSTFFYNADLFAELGLEPPQTYEEFKAVAQTLTEAGHIPVLHQGKNPWMWPMWFFETSAQTMEDPIAKTESNLRGETKFTDPEDVAALAAIGQFVTDGILDGDSLTVDWDGMRSAFATGSSAIYYGGTWELPWLEENVTDFTYGVFPFPKIEGTPGEPRHGGGPDNGICVYSGIAEANLPAAVEFIEYLTRPEVANLYLGAEAPIAVSIAGVTVSESDVAQTLRETTYPNTIRFLDWIWPTEINDAYQAAIQGVVGGTLTAEEGAAQVQQAYDDLVADGYTYP
jgi:raffinose/stachyose/melibiose transport system substrate-binding protein